jgi:hypothetical protein
MRTDLSFGGFMQAWSQFYAVIGSAAAALLGLLFVAVSLNAAHTLGPGHDNIRRLAEQAFHNYLTVLMVSLLALFPQMDRQTFSLVVLGTTGLSAIWGLVRFYQTLFKPTAGESRLFTLRRHLSSLVGFTILVVAALRMGFGSEDERNWLASGTMVLLFSATMVSWMFLGRVARPGQTRSHN